jgi:hypothetical protein
MADNNRNQGDQFYGGNQNWQENRNRMNRNRNHEGGQENEGSFGNAGYGGDFDRSGNFNQMNHGDQQRRVNYIPDNDDNRHDYQSGQGQYANQYRGYGNQGNNMGQQRNQWGNQWGTHYGASFGNQNRQSDQGNYGGQSGWHSVNNISGGYDINNNNDDWRRGDRRNWQGNQGGQYGDYSDRRHDVNYGGNSASNWNNEVRNKDDRGWWDKERRDVSSWMNDRDDNREPRGNRNYPPAMGGMHKGKGPRGYQRSDERIREDVCDRLADDDMLDASEIEVQVNGSEVVLSGTVLSREAKRHAEDLAESISGVRHVENRIRVGRIEDLDGTYTTRQIIRATNGDNNMSSGSNNETNR